jgi:hypothetical protein
MDEDRSKPSSCLLVGVILGMMLIIILSTCGAVRVPRPERLLDVRKDSAFLKELRGDAPPPVVRGDPFILALKSSEDAVKAY